MRTLERALSAHLAYDEVIAGSASDVEGGGRLLRSERFPASWDLNQVVLPPGAGNADVARAVTVAERELDGADYRRVTVFGASEEITAPDGYAKEVLLVMVLPDGPLPEWPEGVREVDPAVLRPLRLELWSTWVDASRAPQLAEMQHAFASGPGARCLAAYEGSEIVGWCQVHAGGIDDVWVFEPHRGRGLGKRVTLAAMAAGGWYLNCDVKDPRPQGLYRKLGFRDAGVIVQLTRRV